MKKIITADNSETFLNEAVGETYHSHTGAVEEALKKYAIPCRIKELAKSGKIRILDMFSGMGYNSAMAIDVALKENPNCKIDVVAIEHDANIIAMIQKVNPNIKYFIHYKQLTPSNLKLKEGNVTVRVILADVHEGVKKLTENSFDAIFYDPFSPKTQPTMWSVELFTQMQRVMKSNAILATYSCARMVRENMQKADLFYDDGPIVGRRGPGTIATKWGKVFEINDESI